MSAARCCSGAKRFVRRLPVTARGVGVIHAADQFRRGFGLETMHQVNRHEHVLERGHGRAGRNVFLAQPIQGQRAHFDQAIQFVGRRCAAIPQMREGIGAPGRARIGIGQVAKTLRDVFLQNGGEPGRLRSSRSENPGSRRGWCACPTRRCRSRKRGSNRCSPSHRSSRPAADNPSPRRDPACWPRSCAASRACARLRAPPVAAAAPATTRARRGSGVAPLA